MAERSSETEAEEACERVRKVVVALRDVPEEELTDAELEQMLIDVKAALEPPLSISELVIKPSQPDQATAS